MRVASPKIVVNSWRRIWPPPCQQGKCCLAVEFFRAYDDQLVRFRVIFREWCNRSAIRDPGMASSGLRASLPIPWIGRAHV